ncbi:MAG: TonB-dependent receptor [Verrucomicrobia bacterium]|nr:TonB-dependent receptor [Verrucomicrobiota bacterium]
MTVRRHPDPGIHPSFCARCVRLSFFLAVVTLGLAQAPAETGKVAGTIVDPVRGRPVEFATVTLRKAAGGEVLRTGATDARGRFDFEGMPAGSYQVSYGMVGAEQASTAVFTVDAAHRTVDLGSIPLGLGEAVTMAKVEVGARKEAFYNSIDRKVYNVGQDVQSVSGSASDLLQNVPSVQVDIEGNVSLRGDSNVLILVNGKTSTMMGKNRAAVLDQLPADSISKIEVITNPSAKYKPDGTAGIINLTLKQKQDTAYSGSLRVSAGNARRYNANLTASYNPGKFTLFLSAGVRQDDRSRTVQDDRSHLDTATNTLVATSQRTSEAMRPLSRIVQTGLDYQFDEHTKAGANVRYNHRGFERHSVVTNLSRGAAGAVTGDYDRYRIDPESQTDLEFTGTVQHSFAGSDRELNLEVRHGRTTEREDNRYTNLYRFPARPASRDFTVINPVETSTETSVDYTHPLGEESKIETGYNGQVSETDMDFHGSFIDAAGALQPDLTKTNHFIYDATIHAFYGTFARKFGAFGLLAGLRFEHAAIDTNQVTARLLGSNDYNRLYPSLHLSQDLTATQQLQLNYSHRVHRPEGDDLNPYPEYQDPFNLRAGNPRLVPEDIHSVEAGWQHKKDDTTYLATVYHRYRYHGMTEVARYISPTTLLTTKENLGTSRATGLELGANTRLRERLSLNFSANAYRSEIDASNLGFSSKRSSFVWDAKLNANYDVTKTTLVQFNTNYTAKRLTPQGYRYPTKVANIGLRHTLADKKTALILTLSDAFNSLRERTHIDTPVLYQDITRHRSSRILYLGVVYNFGKTGKKPKKDELQFDNTP